MGRKKNSGLFKRGGIWHVDKQIGGRRVRESAGTKNLEEALEFLAKRTEDIRKAKVYGVRPKRTFRQAAIKYVSEATKVTIAEDIRQIKALDSFIGHMTLEKIHMGSLQPFIESRQSEGLKTRTVNYGIQTVRRILNMAAGEWIDDNGLTWIQNAPKIKLLPEHDRRKPYPMDWDEQEKLFNELPEHLYWMALFKVNTGCREGEVVSLKWDWEVKVPELGTSVFVIPGYEDGVAITKNRDDRVVVLNEKAKFVVDTLRNIHPVYVFTYKGRNVNKMNDTAWKQARKRAGLEQVRVHDLRHTFARRLRAAGVSFEDRQDLLGHRSSLVTTHYSAAEIQNLIDAANTLCGENPHKIPTMTLLKLKGRKNPGLRLLKKEGLLVGARGFEPPTT